MEVFKAQNQKHYKVNVAIEFINKVLLNDKRKRDEFFDLFENKNNFDMATCSGRHLINNMKKFLSGSQQITVKFYRPMNPWSKAYGYYSASDPYSIHVNERKMNRTTASFIATFIHEWFHMLDMLDTMHNFGHGDNSSVGKDNTVPYWAGVQASKMYGDEQTVEDYPKVTRSSWYVRFIKWLF